MKEYSGEFPITKMADALKVSRGRYYAWLKSPSSDHDRRDSDLSVDITRIFHASRETYGSPRVYLDLKKKGAACSRKRVARIMHENGLRARQKRRFKVTTDSNHDYPIAPNRVERQFFVKEPNSVWVSDITYIWTMEGWLYLCIILDLYSRLAVGWSMDSHIKAELATGALSMAVTQRRPPEGLIFHSDRGVQYASELFRDDLTKFKMVQSMSRKGNCWDNACAESFFATLKKEEVFHHKYTTRDEARKRIFEYITVFYNRHRMHSFLDFLCPEEYESRRNWVSDVA
jgi:transposase InsO family protein